MNWLREADAEPIPGYRLIEPLGTGGFGEVWKCEVPGGLFKAIKFVFGNMNDLDGDAAKAEQEYKALERVKAIRHPFVCSMDRIEVVDGELLIVMELADRSLHDLFEEYKRQGRPGIPRELLLGFLSDAAEGLDHLIEKHNLQHLDVKPKNLFLIGDRVKVADFGLVRNIERASSAGVMGGITPVYAAPETFGNKVSKQSDQYSLAIVYVELLTGEKPFRGKNIRQLAMQHMTEPPDLTRLPEADRAAVARALAKNPEDRFASCGQFIRTLIGTGSATQATLSMPATTPPARAATAEKATVRSRTSPPVTRKSLVRFPAASATLDTLRFEPDAGQLRPAVMIGIGGFGRRALQQIRCRLLDRVGQLSQVPCVRYIYLDSDPDAASKAASGPPDVALNGEQTFIASLQPVTNYRRRQLDQLLEWLPREKLYSIPRSLRVDGSRALGRLAFSDHYLRFVARVRHELQVCSHPEALQQSADHTGLSVRTKQPAVYLFVSASGGTSGMTLDVGHAVRKALEKLNLPATTVTCFVLSGAPADPSSPPEELANIFASLTELNHYADPDVTFAARYGGPEGPLTEAHGLPFTATYLLPMEARTSGAIRDTLSHLAGYVCYDLTTSLGSGLEVVRQTPPTVGRTPFRGFGTFGVWYPRGLLLRSAARQMCIELVRSWSSAVPALPASAEHLLDGILADRRLTPEPVQQFIAEESATKADGQPLNRLAAWLTETAAQADSLGKRGDPAAWAVGLWDTARDWLGTEPTSDADSAFRRGRLSKALDQGLRRAIEAWDNELTARLHALEELPGPRLGAAAVVLERLIETAAGAIDTMERKLEEIAPKREQAKVDVQLALGSLQGVGGAFSLFGNRTAKSVRAVADKVRAFIDLRVVEDLTHAAAQFYRRLWARFDARHRDILAARDRLAALAELMSVPIMMGPSESMHGAPEVSEETTQSSIQGSNTMRVVLPNGENHIDRSAADLLQKISQESLVALEDVLTKVVLSPRGGLVALANSANDLSQPLANPLIDQATAYLANLLPGEDVTAVEFSAARNDPAALTRRVESYLRAAAPLTGGPSEEERTFLLYPDTDFGRRYADTVREVCPKAYPVPIRGAGTDLLFCRELGGLRAADLFRQIEPCWDAYQQSSDHILHNPHSRFDVTEWLPLVE
jgi:eukaryotic-like serine/threonine-protein kinase